MVFISQVLMSGVMFSLFKQASEQGQLSMLQDWVLSALPNFTHRSPLSHSIWCLTVFFVCAATSNPYLQVSFLGYPNWFLLNDIIVTLQ